MNCRFPSSRYGLLGAIALAATIVATPVPAQETIQSGTWRYKDRGVWIQLQSDGRAYQCRIDKDETTTYTSAGNVAKNKIKWEAIWGENEIEVVGDSLFLVASGRRLEFTRATRPMDAICRNPLPPS
jgi:hypothetical protein